jgi:predicted AAA+ superfamily ATPase
MKRSIEDFIRKDLKRKIVLLTGPRQAGKTTLAKMLKREKTYPDGVEIRTAQNWLSEMSLEG